MSFLGKISKVFQKEKKKLKELDIKTKFMDEFVEVELGDSFFNYYEIRDIINQYEAIEVLETYKLKIEYKDLYNFYYDEFENEISIYEFLNLPSLFRGIVEIENKNNFLVDEDIRYTFKFRFLSEGYIIKNKNILESEITKEKRLIGRGVYDLIEKIIEYNKDEKKRKNIFNQFEMLKILKESSIITDIKLNERLKREEEPIIIEKLKIDCEDDGEVLNIFPVLDVDKEINNEIIRNIKSFNKTRHDYSIKINGKKKRYIIKDTNSLDKVLDLEKVQGSKRLQTLSGQGEIFEDDNIDVSLFGPRVTGIGYLNYRGNSGSSNTSDLNWLDCDGELPFFGTSNLEGDYEKIVLKPKDRFMMQQKLCEIEENNLESVEVEFEGAEGRCVKVLMKGNDLKQEIKKLGKSIKNLTKISNVKDLEKIKKEEPDEDGYIQYKGKYIFVGHGNFKKEIEDKLDKKEYKKKEKMLLIAENFENADYEEIKKSNNYLREAILPSSIKEGINLFDYQKECLRKLQEVYLGNNRNGFLLCDDMGLGKTLQLLSFLAWLKEEKKLRPTLIIAPTSLLNNWDSDESGEIQKFFKKNTFKTIKVKGKINEERVGELEKIDIVFTTYESLRINNILFGRINWKIMICDEAQKIKNPTAKITIAAKAQNADFKIICSATPIENSLEDLWCLVDYSKPGLLGSLRDFKKNYVNNKNITSKELNDELTEGLSKFYLRREKEILPKALPKKIIKIYRIKPLEEEVRVIEGIKETEEYSITAIQKMLAVSGHIDILGNNLINSETIEKFIKRSSKLNKTLEILEEIEKSKEKVIIFTRLKKVQRILYYAIKEKFRIDVTIVNGEENNLNKRTKMINDFKKSKGFNVIILSPEVAGFGITVTEANHVIHYTRLWNPAKEDQATDRTYRIGQDKEVYVHYPIISYNEESTKTYDNVENYVDDNKDKQGRTSPEENLNILIARKKDMLLNFFLAGAGIDIGLNEFQKLEEKKEKRKINISDIKARGYSISEMREIIANSYKEEGYEVEVNKGLYGADIEVKRDGNIKVIVLKLSTDKEDINKIKAAKEKYVNKENIDFEFINIDSEKWFKENLSLVL